METDVLRHFIGRDVEILVGGAWVDGHMQPIVKGVITLIPFKDVAHFYGPTAVKAESVQAIRQVIRSGVPLADPSPQANTTAGGVPVRSSLDQVQNSGNKFVHAEKRRG
jgi:hypothetical protein